MNYTQCLAYLERLGNEVETMKFGLETTRTLLGALGGPHRKYPCLLIGGTNGKGSVAHFLSSISSSCGIRSALYTSPHMVRLEERFCVGSQAIEPEVFAHYLTRTVQTIERLRFPAHPTYFETLTAAALLWFSEQEVEIAFLEVGMGGRLDSTNVVAPILSILTPIGLDHQKFLGHTIEAISGEKAGILRERRPALLAPQRPEVQQVLLEKAAAKRSRVVELKAEEIECLGSDEGRYRFRFHGFECPLRLYGKHQLVNAALAIQAAEILIEQGFPFSSDGIRKGVAETCCGGRLQKIRETPAVFLDGAHNVEAGENLVRFVREHTEEPRSLVFGMMRDKDVAQMLQILKPPFDRVYLTKANSQRAATVEQLKELLPEGIPVPYPFDAYRRAQERTATVVVTGSFYLAGEILKQLAADRLTS